MSSHDVPFGAETAVPESAPPSNAPPVAKAVISPQLHAGSMPTNPRFNVSDALTVGGGLMVLLFSFFPFVSYSDSLRGPIERSGYDTWFNAWQAQTFMAPLTWFVVLGAVTASGLSAAGYLTGHQLKLLRFSAPQLQVMCSAFAFLVLLGYATSSRSVVFGSDYARYLGDATFAHGINFSAGGYLMLTFALVTVVGALLTLYNVGPTLLPRPKLVDSAKPVATQTPSPLG